jgi:hypothetical protein
MKAWRRPLLLAATLAAMAPGASVAAGGGPHSPRVRVQECAPLQFTDKPCAREQGAASTQALPQTRLIWLASGPDRSLEDQARAQAQLKAVVLELDRLQHTRSRLAAEESGWPPAARPRPRPAPTCPAAQREPASLAIQGMRLRSSAPSSGPFSAHLPSRPPRLRPTPACFGLPPQHPACLLSAPAR